MGQEDPGKEQQLFMYLVGTFQSSAWNALGKMKNPMIDKILDEVIDEYQLNEGTAQMSKVFDELDKKFPKYKK